MSEAALLTRLTSLCLALPEASADDRHPPHRGFVVNKKNFAWFTVNEHGDGRVALGVRADDNENEELVASDPQRFVCSATKSWREWAVSSSTGSLTAIT
jgi:hypothetical protein